MSYSFANSMCQIWTGFVKSYSRTHATISQSLLRSFHSSRIQNATESKDQESGQEDAGKEASKDKRREYARKYYQKILNDPNVYNAKGSNGGAGMLKTILTILRSNRKD